MSTAREYFDAGNKWTDITTRQALPLLLALARSGSTWTYGELHREILRRYELPPTKMGIRYKYVLYKLGDALNQLADEWGAEIPPLTILIKGAKSDEPSSGVDEFLNRYMSAERSLQLTANNRKAMVDWATNAVFAYDHWDEIACYFGAMIPNDSLGYGGDDQPIVLAPAIAGMGGEGAKHRSLKEYLASHPELFADYGVFGPGTLEFRLDSGDEIDVLFINADQALAIEVKTEDAPAGELTRGIFQCVKYLAVLRAMHQLAADPKFVQVILATPQKLTAEYKSAAVRLGVKWQRVAQQR